MKFYLITTFLILLASSEVIPFNNDAIKKVFKESTDTLFLFIDDYATQSDSLAELKAYEAKTYGLVVSVSSKNDGYGLFDRLTNYIGVDVSALPQVFYISSKQKKYRFDYRDITASNLADFVQSIKNGEAEPFLKSAPAPESNDKPVKVIVGKTFKEQVLDTDKQILVMFYAPWCTRCERLAPQFDKAAQLLAANPNIILAKFDSTRNEIAGVDIQEFPTLKFWGKEKSVAIDFTGERDTKGIIQWLKKHTSFEWIDSVASNSEELVQETL